MIELAHAWRVPPHTLFDYGDDVLATMADILEQRAAAMEEKTR